MAIKKAIVIEKTRRTFPFRTFLDPRRRFLFRTLSAVGCGRYFSSFTTILIGFFLFDEPKTKTLVTTKKKQFKGGAKKPKMKDVGH